MPTEKQSPESFSFSLFGLIKFACTKPGKHSVRMLVAVLVFILLLILLTALFFRPPILASIAALRLQLLIGQWGNKVLHWLNR